VQDGGELRPCRRVVGGTAGIAVRARVNMI
jgi:hypothetical protein